MRLSSPILALSAAVGLAGCATAPATKAGPNDAARAVVHLAPTAGSPVTGTLQLVAQGQGVHISGQLSGLAPHTAHGFHFHEKGDCSAPDGSSAGGHFNPTSDPHGRAGAGPHHAGDMDNIVANDQGEATIDVQDDDVSLRPGAPNDVVGRAVIIHGSADDYTSQPSGNAGARVACGVVQAQ